MKRILVMIMLLCSMIIYASDTNASLKNDVIKNKNITGTQVLHRFAITVSYFGEWITHPGFTLGLEFDVFKNKKDWYKIIAAGNIGMYVHVKNHVGLFFDIEFGNRFTTPIGYFADFFLGIGYHHSWAYGKLYSGVDNNGNLIEEPNYGDPHLYLVVSIGAVGWDFEKNRLIPLSIYFRGLVFTEYPTNSFIIPHVCLQAGFSYKFKSIQPSRN